MPYDFDVTNPEKANDIRHPESNDHEGAIYRMVQSSRKESKLRPSLAVSLARFQRGCGTDHGDVANRSCYRVPCLYRHFKTVIGVNMARTTNPPSQRTLYPITAPPWAELKWRIES